MKQKITLVDGSVEEVMVDQNGFPIFSKILLPDTKQNVDVIVRPKFRNNMFAPRSKQHPI